MDGISANLTAAATQLSSSETAGAVQVKALKEALDQAGSTLLPLLEGLGEHVDALA
jgi:hypothetical protein